MKGQTVGYVRVSAIDQNEGRQIEGFRQAGIELDKVFIDKASGKSIKRPGLEKCLDYIREGDVLCVHSIDRLARNLYDLRKLVSDLTGKGVAIRFIKENMFFTAADAENPMSSFMLNMLGSFAEFERQIMRERQREGIALAKKQGRRLGRAKSVKPEQAVEMRRRAKAGDSISAIARDFGFSRPTIYRYIDDA